MHLSLSKSKADVFSFLQSNLLGGKCITDNHRVTMEKMCSIPNVLVFICWLSSHITLVTLPMLAVMFFPRNKCLVLDGQQDKNFYFVCCELVDSLADP